MSRICKNCGAMMSDDVKFCGECGTAAERPAAPVYAEPEVVDVEVIAPPRQRFEGVGADARDVRERLVGTKTEYYLPKFETMEALNSFTSWNWAAFFFGNIWMVYRKMYVFGGALWLVGILLQVMGLQGLSLVFSIGIGIVGNYLYMKDIDNRTEKAMNMQPEERERYIQKNSGTGWGAVIIVYIIAFVITFMLV